MTQPAASSPFKFRPEFEAALNGLRDFKADVNKRLDTKGLPDLKAMVVLGGHCKCKVPGSCIDGLIDKTLALLYAVGTEPEVAADMVYGAATDAYSMLDVSDAVM